MRDNISYNYYLAAFIAIKFKALMEGAPPNKYFYRYRAPAPAKDLLVEFWRLEKEAEKMLEGLAK